MFKNVSRRIYPDILFKEGIVDKVSGAHDANSPRTADPMVVPIAKHTASIEHVDKVRVMISPYIVQVFSCGEVLGREE